LLLTSNHIDTFFVVNFIMRTHGNVRYISVSEIKFFAMMQTDKDILNINKGIV